METETIDYNLSEFQVVHVLHNNVKEKSITLLGKFPDSSHRLAVVILEKTAFDLNDFLESTFFNTVQLEEGFLEGVYGNFKITQQIPELNKLKITVIYPATQADINEFSVNETVIVEEVPTIKIIKNQVISTPVEKKTEERPKQINHIIGDTSKAKQIHSYISTLIEKKTEERPKQINLVIGETSNAKKTSAPVTYKLQVDESDSDTASEQETFIIEDTPELDELLNSDLYSANDNETSEEEEDSEDEVEIIEDSQILLKNEKKMKKIKERHLTPANILDRTCPICNMVFLAKRSVARHIGKKHVSPPIPTQKTKCNLCGRMCPGNYGRHVQLFHTPKPSMCVVCKRIFNTLHELTVHQNENQEFCGVTCKICKHSFGSRHKLKRHLDGKRACKLKKPKTKEKEDQYV